MDSRLCVVPAQILTDAGLTRASRLCLSVMYLHIESDGFCPLTATELGALMGSTYNSVRRYWDVLRECGYIREAKRNSLRRRRRAIKGNDVALSLDGTRFPWAADLRVGSDYLNEGAAE